MDERITSMIPRYGKLNKIYTEIMSGGSFSFEKQQFISDFYREYGDTQTRKGNSLIRYHPGKPTRLFPHATAVSHL